MKVLLTGAGGFLGQRIVSSLIDHGVADLTLHFRQVPRDGSIDALRARYPGTRINVVGANLLTAPSVAPIVEGIDCVVHAAAGLRGAAADIFANTVIGTRHLVEAACAANVRKFVLISSFSVYRTTDLARYATLDESVPLESTGVEKGAYAYAKTRQESLVLTLNTPARFELITLRPGVIYGPGGGALSPRVGIQALGLFFALGGRAPLPLTYVDNCADAIAVSAINGVGGSVFNVVDDDLPTCGEYLRRYRREVRPLRAVPVPYPLFLAGSRALSHYHRISKGQLPAVFTPYIVRSMYRPLRYSNQSLKQIGWTQRVPTSEALETAFSHWRAQLA